MELFVNYLPNMNRDTSDALLVVRQLDEKLCKINRALYSQKLSLVQDQLDQLLDMKAHFTVQRANAAKVVHESMNAHRKRVATWRTTNTQAELAGAALLEQALQLVSDDGLTC